MFTQRYPISISRRQDVRADRFKRNRDSPGSSGASEDVVVHVENIQGALGRKAGVSCADRQAIAESDFLSCLPIAARPVRLGDAGLFSNNAPVSLWSRPFQSLRTGVRKLYWNL